MPSFERAGGIPLLNMMSGWGPSRATNPSSGDDPLTLGIAPGASAPVAPPIIYQPTVVEQGVHTALPPMLPDMPDEELPPSPSAPPSPLLAEILVNLSRNVALLKGRTIQLNFEDHDAVMRVLINAYERGIKEEIFSLRMEHLSTLSGRESDASPSLRSPDQQATVVPEVPHLDAGSQPAEAGHPRTTSVLTVPATAPNRKRRVPVVPRIREGAPAPSPPA